MEGGFSQELSMALDIRFSCIALIKDREKELRGLSIFDFKRRRQLKRQIKELEQHIDDAWKELVPADDRT